MNNESGRGGRLIIEGVDEDGRKFRPSDWAERLAALSAKFGADHRLHYSRAVHPGVIDGGSCLVIDGNLQACDPDAYAFILKFARDNRLRLRREDAVAAPQPAPFPIPEPTA